MLVYCKDNLTKVKASTRTYEDQEEEDAEEEFVFEDEATEALVEGSAKIKHLGTSKRSKLSVSPVSSRARSHAGNPVTLS